MKKSSSLLVLSVFPINFVNAQFFGGGYGGGYGSFSITDLFERFGSDNIIYLSLFLILFVFIATILKRVGIFRDAYRNPDTKSIAVISLAISLMATYGIYRSDYDIESLFYNFGFSANSLYPVLAIILILASIFIIWKFRIGTFLIILGLLLGLTTLFTEIIYEKTAAIIIAVVMLLVGFLLLSRVRNKIGGAYNWQKEKSQWGGRIYVLILGVLIVILGLVLNQTIVTIAGAVLALIGLWLWGRKKPGLYRPLDFRKGYSPVQERRQLRSGNPLMLIGALIVIFGFVLQAYWGVSQTATYVIAGIGAVLVVIGLFLRLR